MFSKKDIIISLRNIGLKNGDNVLVQSDLRLLGKYEKQNNLCKDLFEAISNIIDLKKGTIFVQTSSTYLCNTNKVFDIKKLKVKEELFLIMFLH